MLMKGKMIQFGYKGKEFQASKVPLSTRVVTDMVAVTQENSRTIRQTLSLLQGKAKNRCTNAEHS
ncbi:hypothetical protein T01_6562 [Trichinella spiralis]|uniref:Uncharacterized protein n=1 Tax=Trichinella spiralis TaxID=6334 RepID=A0A0V0YXS8_TRISP|nr:hypothetical protein T01_6562 [Trichinella spiralis]